MSEIDGSRGEDHSPDDVSGATTLVFPPDRHRRGRRPDGASRSSRARADTVAAAVDGDGRLPDRQGPARIEDHWQVLTKGGFYRGGPVLLERRRRDRPGAVGHRRQGRTACRSTSCSAATVRDRVRVLRLDRRRPPDEVAEHGAAAGRSRASTAIKMNGAGELRPHRDAAAQIDAVVDRVAAIREAIGPDSRHRDRLPRPRSRRRWPAALLPLLEPYLPLFVEEPRAAGERRGARRDRGASTSIPIATGERLYSRWDFKPILDGGVAVAQPDLSHAGGISEVRRIAAMAETYDVALAPHCPLGPDRSGGLRCSSTSRCPNVLIQEQSLGHPLQRGLATARLPGRPVGVRVRRRLRRRGRPCRGSASRWTRRRSSERQGWGIGGVRRPSAATTDPSPSGEL